MQVCLHREDHLLWRLQDGPLSASPIFAKHRVISKPPNPFWDLQEKAASCLPAVWTQGCLEGWEEQHRTVGSGSEREKGLITAGCP